MEPISEGSFFFYLGRPLKNLLVKRLSPCLTNHRWLRIIDWSYFKRRVTRAYLHWTDAHLKPQVVSPSHALDLLAEQYQDVPVYMTLGILFSTGARGEWCVIVLLWALERQRSSSAIETLVGSLHITTSQADSEQILEHGSLRRDTDLKMSFVVETPSSGGYF